MKKSQIHVLLAGLIMALAGTAEAEAAIRVCGGQASLSTFFFPAKGAFEENIGIKIELKTSSTVQGILDVNGGICDISGGTTPLAKVKENAGIKGKGIDLSTFKEHPLGNVAILAFTHKQNPVKALSKEQLKGIFTGKITNWKAVGGEDREIVIIWGNTPGQNAIFKNTILDNEPVLENHAKASDYLDIRKRVAAMPGAIGINGEGFKNGDVKAPTIPAVVEAAYAYTKGEASPDVQKLLNFIKETETGN